MRGGVQRKIALGVARVGVGALAQQRARHRDIAFERGPEERRLAGVVQRARIGARGYEPRGEPGVFRERGIVQYRLAAFGANRDIRAACQELLDKLSFTFLYRLVQCTLACAGDGQVTRQQQGGWHAERNVPKSLNKYLAYGNCDTAVLLDSPTLRGQARPLVHPPS